MILNLLDKTDSSELWPCIFLHTNLQFHVSLIFCGVKGHTDSQSCRIHSRAKATAKVSLVYVAIWCSDVWNSFHQVKWSFPKTGACFALIFCKLDIRLILQLLSWYQHLILLCTLRTVTLKHVNIFFPFAYSKSPFQNTKASELRSPCLILHHKLSYSIA